MSSISGSDGKPPISSNSARATNIPWSPVAMPVSRERRFIIFATTGSSGERPSIATSNRPQRRPAPGSAAARRRSASAETWVSACRNTRRSPPATRAPAFICAARPRSLSTTRSASAAATSQRRVAAATVGDDDLVARSAQRLQRGERRGKRGRLVQRRDDDRQAHQGSRRRCAAARRRPSRAGSRANMPSRANAASVSGETRPCSDSIRPSVCPRFTNTKVPGMMPTNVASDVRPQRYRRERGREVDEEERKQRHQAQEQEVAERIVGEAGVDLLAQRAQARARGVGEHVARGEEHQRRADRRREHDQHACRPSGRR